MTRAICGSASIRSSSSFFLPSNTRLTNDNANSRPITASVCNSSFSSGGSRSMREARIACTVAGTLTAFIDLASFTAPLGDQRTVIEQHQHHLFHEEGIAFGALDDELFEFFDVV